MPQLPPPAPDTGAAAPPSSSASGTHFSPFGISILSIRRDQIHHPDAGELEAEAFQNSVGEVILSFIAGDSSTVEGGGGEVDSGFLSLSWLRRSLDAFLICFEQFRALIFGGTAVKSPANRLVLDFFDRAVKSLDLCNAVRDGANHIRHFRRHLSVVSDTIDTNSDYPIGEGQIRRIRKALADLTILMLEDKEPGGSAGHQNSSFGRRGNHSRNSSGGSSSGSSIPIRSLSWSVSRSWSAQKQLNAIATGLTAPRAHDITSSNGIAAVVYAMGTILFVVMYGLVAAIPCQDRGLQVHFSVPRNFPWAVPVNSVYDRIVEESKKKERKISCGLLKEINQIEIYSQRLLEVTDEDHFPLSSEKEAEVREIVKGINELCTTLNEGIDPLERHIREVFHRIVRSRTEILDCLGLQHVPE